MDNIIKNFGKISFAQNSNSNRSKFDQDSEKFLAKSGKESESCATSGAMPRAFNNGSDARRPTRRIEFGGLISGHQSGVVEGGNQVRVVKFNPRKLKQGISYNDGLKKTNNMVKKGNKIHSKRLELKKTSKDDIQDRLNKSFDSAMVCEEAQSNPNDNIKTTMDDILL